MQNQLQVLLDTILNSPLWVQEVIYLDVKSHLDAALKVVATDTEVKEPVYPAYIPEITFKGKRELDTHEHNLELNHYKLLKCANESQRIIDITLSNFWTLEEASACLSDCIEQEYIKMPENSFIYASICYLGNKIRLGEYVKKINKINIEELDDILRQQKKYNEQNPDAKLKVGEIMVKMGYVATQDIDKMIYTKEESKKRFILSAPKLQTESNVSSQEIALLKNKIQKLTEENNLLKNKLREIFNIQNKHK